jgi:hypothetical protein
MFDFIHIQLQRDKVIFQSKMEINNKVLMNLF